MTTKTPKTAPKTTPKESLLDIKKDSKTLLTKMKRAEKGNDTFQKDKDVYMNSYFLIIKRMVKHTGYTVPACKNILFAASKIAVMGQTAKKDKVSGEYVLDKGYKWLSESSKGTSTLEGANSVMNQIDVKTKGEKTVLSFNTYGELRSAYEAINKLAQENKAKGKKKEAEPKKAKGKKTVTLTEAIATIKAESSVLGNFLEYAVKHGGLDSSDIIKGVAKIQRDMNESMPTPTRKESLSKAVAH